MMEPDYRYCCNPVLNHKALTSFSPFILALPSSELVPFLTLQEMAKSVPSTVS